MPALTAGALVLAGLSFSTVPAIAAPVAAEATPAPGATIDRTNKQQILDVFKWINQYRASLGVPPVTFNATISEVAEDWSDNMAATGFRHNPGYWTDPRVTDRWTHAAEIIAANSDEEGEALVIQWINSPSHEAILRDPAYKVIGIGITRSATGPYSTYGTVNFFTYPEGLDPAGAYTTAQDFFDGKPTNDATAITPAAPTFNNPTSEYVIPAQQPGVDYYVGDVLQTPGTHFSGWQSVTITARATSGYVLRGTTSWAFTFQPKRITASAPTFNDAAGTYTIPAQDGVRYLVGDGTHGSERATPSGTYPGTGLVTVSVQAAEGYVLENDWAGWSHNFPVPTPPVTEPPVITPPGPSPSFTDISTSGFQGDIGWMKDRGISTGYTDGTYRPAESVSREAMAAFVYRLAGKPSYTAPARSPFADVPTNHLFYKEISWMRASGLSTGWADGTYRPSDTVSREAMAAFMKRFAGNFCSRYGALHFGAPSVPTFADSRSSIFYADIEWMRVAGVSTGWPDRTYRPFENVTREAMAAFMQRLDAYITANGGCPAQ
ncbi:S-layer homology domain-containing protein [Pseudarthrobacter equi]|uniref:CAP and S-layer homology domain-containing protein n=1 Tax=Pseudarthrobacter equi TaxID=728066 RepID=UPI0021BE72DC|nr:S-layer homology domain-containing protein [Pseudarthrobacter equi]MCT9625611.1 S-layer homology domain-containing protein [Pseudarthrobacter equi]